MFSKENHKGLLF